MNLKLRRVFTALFSFEILIMSLASINCNTPSGISFAPPSISPEVLNSDGHTGNAEMSRHFAWHRDQNPERQMNREPHPKKSFVLF